MWYTGTQNILIHKLCLLERQVLKAVGGALMGKGLAGGVEVGVSPDSTHLGK